jgi:hypothetical protein
MPRAGSDERTGAAEVRGRSGDPEPAREEPGAKPPRATSPSNHSDELDQPHTQDTQTHRQDRPNRRARPTTPTNQTDEHRPELVSCW